MTTNSHIHRQQRGMISASENVLIKEFSSKIGVQILEFVESIATDSIILPDNDCQECEERAIDSESDFADILFDMILDKVRREFL